MRHFASMCVVLSCALVGVAEDLQLDKIKLPKGFSISVYAKDLPGARSMALSDKGILYVGSRSGDHFFAAQDKDGDGTAETIHKIGSGMSSPNGVAFKDGALYVAEISRILKYVGMDEKLESPPEPVVVTDKLPTEAMHGWKYLAFGPDERLYFNLGAPCDICGDDVLGTEFATIKSIKVDGSDMQTYASGVRNTVGFAWHPVSKELWFTDNGRDMMGDDLPACELNRATGPGQHFGYPYCHGGDVPDPKFAGDKGCTGSVAPAQKMDAHVAPLGMKFYTGNKFPAEYKNAIFIAEHGSWNRSIPQGYRITVVKPDEQGNCSGFEVFAEGWLHRTQAWGRPVDILVMPDGSMLVSDDKAGAVYRISYSG